MGLERQIKIKDSYLELIRDIIYDYDGENSIEGLKSLLKEAADLASKAIENDDYSCIYMGSNSKYNILFEEII